MARYYELTVMVRAGDESKSPDAFSAAVDRVAARLDGVAFHRVREVSERDVPMILRNAPEEADDGV